MNIKLVVVGPTDALVGIKCELGQDGMMSGGFPTFQWKCRHLSCCSMTTESMTGNKVHDNSFAMSEFKSMIISTLY